MARDIKARPRAPRARVIPTKYLRGECETLVRTVRHLGLATDEEIDPHRPGGAENSATDAYGWLAFYRRLQRLHARIETRAGAGAARSQAAVSDDEVVLGALRADPVSVTLVETGDDGPRALTVRPLSEHALRHLDARDDLLTCLARHAQALAASQRPDDLVTRMQLLEEITYQRLLCVWICTSETAPRLPFDPCITPRPEVPEALRAMHPIDALRVQAAHHRLNSLALTVLRRTVALDDGGEAQGSWRTFFSMLEKESHWTIPASQFMRDRALVSLLAARMLAADAEQRAYDAAKAKADEEARRRR